MSWDLGLLALGLGAVVGAMTLLWLLSLALRDASIVDPFWGSGFVGLAWLYRVLGPEAGPRQWLLLALVTAWGLRLSLYLLVRNWGEGEDYRYREMRQAHGAAFWWRSLFTVFLLQGALLWFIALPLFAVQTAAAGRGWLWTDLLGLGLWGVGFFFEAVGDWQLARFKADPAHRGQVMTRGVWALTRHPNYFGDAAVWWGYYLIALGVPGGAWTVSSPLVMTLLLLKVSGVALLEKSIAERRPGYREYARRTSAFIPWFPGKPSGP